MAGWGFRTVSFSIFLFINLYWGPERICFCVKSIIILFVALDFLIN